ncbi:MAG: sigma-70 family RNA polymerase sigma factor [Cytophagales bacterium]
MNRDLKRLKLFRLNRPLSEYSDAELIDKFAEDENIEYSAELFLRYKDLIYGVGLKYLKNANDSRDMSMEVFEELHKKLSNHKVQNFKSWLYVLVRNHCLMQLRSSQKHVETKLSKKNEGIHVEKPLELHPIEEREIKYQQLESAIDELEDKQAQCLKMFYYEEMSYQDIADKTGYEIKKVKSYIQNGKRNLKGKLE